MNNLKKIVYVNYKTDNYNYPVNARIASNLCRFVRSRGYKMKKLSVLVGLSEASLTSQLTFKQRLKKDLAEKIANIIGLEINFETGDVKNVNS